MTDLATLPIFSGVDTGLLGLITPDMVKRYGDGEALYLQDSAPTELFILQTGQVRLERDGKEIATLQTGEVIGEQAVLEGKPRSVTAICEGEVSVWVLPVEAISELISNTAFRNNLRNVTEDRIRGGAQSG